MPSRSRSALPLLVLCALSAAVLNLYPLLDPLGTYAPYLAALEGATPPVAALAAAASDGVYPWSTPRADAPDAGDVLPPDTADTLDAAQPDDSADALLDADSAPDAVPDEPVAVFTTVGADYFDDALFLGDSHTDGFKDYAGLPNATYLCHNGLTVWSALEKSFQTANGKVTLDEALTQRQYGKIYIMLGINELGTGTAESWAEQYAVLLNDIRARQPDALIFLQAIFHTTQEKSETSYFKNETIDARNAELEKLADGEQVFYIDCNPVFDDETGALRADYSGDGVHVKAAHYVEWRDYLFTFGVVRDAKTEAVTAADEAPATED